MHTPGPWGFYPAGCDELGYDLSSNVPDGARGTFRNRDDAQLAAASPDLLAFAQAHERWEAEFILDSECWPVNESGMPIFSEAIYDKFMALQAMRNAAIAKATGAV